MNSKAIYSPWPDDQAIVVSASRRHAFLTSDRLTCFKATSSSKAVNLVTGDIVRFIQKGDDYVVESILPRSNTLSRSYRNETRDLVANLAHLIIVSAVPPLFNTLFIDRVLVTAFYESIPVTLVVNKIDLGLSACETQVEMYRELGIQVLLTAAKHGQGLQELRELLAVPEKRILALTGVSGVGKSTILNKLIPDASQQVGEVSSKTGQGKQTTTQPHGFLYHAQPGVPGVMLIDLPGLQNFGVSHLTQDVVAHGFPDIQRLLPQCKYSSCRHLLEEDCGIKRAVERGELAASRYESYCYMCREIEEAKPY